MTSYLLLRNNKESGPYSTDDLIRLGLKAYDLVWIQGKSAAWRYPSEVEELKPYAPATEEQPFDRFYKKNTDIKEEVKSQSPVAKEEPFKQEPSFIAPEHEKYIPKKSVFVTMPGGQKIAASQPVKKDPVPATTDVPVATEKAKPLTAAAQPTISISENPATAEIKYSQPLDDIKEMYVKTLQDRKQKIARKNFWLQGLKKAAVIGGLIALGLVAGLLFRDKDDKKEQVAQRQETTPSTLQSVKQEPTVTPENKNESLIKDEAAATGEVVQNLPPPTGGYVNKKSEEPTLQTNKPIDKQAEKNTKKETTLKSSESDFTNGLVAQGVDVDPATGERTRKLRNSNSPEHKSAEVKKADEKSFSASELGGLVTVTSNDYKKVAFGGIRDLQLTVTNDTKYILDNVIVELQYIKPNETPLKTENIQFKSVAPGEASTIKIPDTNRGMKVTYKIIHVKSQQMNEGVAGN